MELKNEDQARMAAQNQDLKNQIAQLQASVRHYKNKIELQNSKIKGGNQVIEVPCNHMEEINQLEVHLTSKQNELANLRRMLTGEQRKDQGDLQ